MIQRDDFTIRKRLFKINLSFIAFLKKQISVIRNLVKVITCITNDEGDYKIYPDKKKLNDQYMTIYAKTTGWDMDSLDPLSATSKN